MEPPRRGFKGIWIPSEVWLSKELTTMEKVIFAEIHSLDNEDGCYASNAYLGDLFGVSGRQIGKHIASLKKKGCISVKIINLNDRTIRVTSKYAYAKPSQVKKLREQQSDLVKHFRSDNWAQRKRFPPQGV